MTSFELKVHLKERGLPTVGLKKDLIERLQQSDATLPDATRADHRRDVGAGSQWDAFASSSESDESDEGASEEQDPAAGTSLQYSTSASHTLPPRSAMRKREIVDQLGRLGESDARGTKKELYERLQAAVARHGEIGSAPAPGASEGAVDRDRLLDPAFDPSKLTVKELRDILQSFEVLQVSKMRKHDLIAAVRKLVDERAVISELRGDGATASDDGGAEQELSRAARENVEEWSVDRCRVELARRALDASGSDAQVRERLELVLLMEGASAGQLGDREASIRSRVQEMAFGDLVSELKLRGLVWSNRTRAELEATLVERLLREEETAADLTIPDTGEAASDDAFDWGDFGDEKGGGASSRDATEAAPPRPLLHSAYHMLLADRTERVRVAVLAGGPPREARVSFASARTIMDMLATRPHTEQEAFLEHVMRQDGYEEELAAFQQQGVTVDAFYIDRRLQPWSIAPIELYASTPDELEARLPNTGTRLAGLDALALRLREQADIVFPAMQGAFGEGGALQSVLEAHGVPFVGSSAVPSFVAFNKLACAEALMDSGFPVVHRTRLADSDFDEAGNLLEASRQRLAIWAAATGVDADLDRIVVKPADGSSGVDVIVEQGLAAATAAAHALLASGTTPLVVVEPRIVGGMEFACVVLETEDGPTALAPTAVEVVDYEDDIVDSERDRIIAAAERQPGVAGVTVDEDDFDDDEVATPPSFPRSGVPSNAMRTHTPPKLPVNMIQAIRRLSERVFDELELRDAARIDGWLFVQPNEYAAAMLHRYYDTHITGQALDPGWEDVTPGESPVERERPFATLGDLTQEELEATGPQWQDMPVEEVVWAASHDRYYSESQMEHQVAAEEAWLQQQEESPVDVLSVAPDSPQRATSRGRQKTIDLVMPKSATLGASNRALAAPEGAVVVVSDVNPVAALDADGVLFQQAAALGLSHAAILRHLAAGALRRARLPPLPEPHVTVPIDPITASSAHDVPELAAEGADVPNAAGAPSRAGPQPVYILCGGDSSERQVSLASGITAYLQLRKFGDLEVQLFMLAPQFAGLRERRRRSELLRARNDLLSIGVAEDELPVESSLGYIRRPPLELVPLERRTVWAVPHALALRHSCEAVVEACEQLTLTAQTAAPARPPDAADGLDLTQQMMWELAQGGVRDVGAAFEGVTAPRTSAIDFEGFAYHAQANGAVVYNLVQGDVGSDGTIQEFCSHFSIPCTGSRELACSVCNDKLQTAEVLESLAGEDVFTIPKYEVLVGDLEDIFDEPDLANAAVLEFRDELQLTEDAAMVIKPISDGSSTGVMRVEDGADLAIYAAAVVCEWDAIPAAIAPDSDVDVPMPPTPPAAFIVEPFIQTDRLDIVETPPEAPAPVEVRHESASGFLEVSIGVYGPRGDMDAMLPSAALKSGPILTLQDRLQSGRGIALTPPPASVVSEDAVLAAKEKATLVANTLQLSGVARIDAFMRVSDGALYIIDVNTVPTLASNAELYAQALAEQPPLYPGDFLRVQLLLALSASAEGHTDAHETEGNAGAAQQGGLQRAAFDDEDDGVQGALYGDTRFGADDEGLGAWDGDEGGAADDALLDEDEFLDDSLGWSQGMHDSAV